MTQDEWIRAYLVPVVEMEPLNPLYQSEDQWACEQAKDSHERESEYGGMEVVEYEGTFYLVMDD